MIVEYMPYARHSAVRYAARGRIGEDLRRVAYVGSIKAVDNFDPEYGTAFPSYATPTIPGELKRYFRDHTRAVHVPRGVQELNGRMQPATDVLTQHLHRAPTVPELAGILLADPGDVLEAIDATGLHHLDSFGYAGQAHPAPVLLQRDVPGADRSRAGVSQMQICRLLAAILKRLRQGVNCETGP